MALFAALALAGRWAGLGAGALVVLLLGYAVASELIQGFTPLARSASPADALADALGVGIGLLAWVPIGRRLPPVP
ncbi:hypothetical protein [Blastococcus brunescens]|uniref:VanZ family protein n=1 Tax=Blastococcus brunescens TaxID=1564165 RepID=A0ABZ1AYC9_9ACTN|nr:hypothetical protein [Blastococcus sp. BMG 8361]WRL62491.1 hypothetical protein U6N30_21125 [Blastococcus sp. BMG 8361]